MTLGTFSFKYFCPGLRIARRHIHFRFCSRHCREEASKLKANKTLRFSFLIYSKCRKKQRKSVFPSSSKKNHEKRLLSPDGAHAADPNGWLLYSCGCQFQYIKTNLSIDKVVVKYTSILPISGLLSRPGACLTIITLDTKTCNMANLQVEYVALAVPKTVLTMGVPPMMLMLTRDDAIGRWSL